MEQCVGFLLTTRLTAVMEIAALNAEMTHLLVSESL